MSTRFGPESPRPTSALTERYLRWLPLDPDDGEDLFNFGPVYNARLAFELGKLGEVDFDDRVCYVGPERGCALRHLATELSLVRPVLHLLPAALLPAGAAQGDDAARTVGDRSAEQFFREWRPGGPIFDKIVVRDAHAVLQEPALFYAAAVRALHPQRGKMLLVHRPIPLTSLPFRAVALAAVVQQAPGVEEVLDEFKVEGFDLDWELQHVPLVLAKTKWLAMLGRRFPDHLLAASDAEVASLLRELVDGPFKYCGRAFECEDALLFACLSPPARAGPGVEHRRQADAWPGRHQRAAAELSRGVALDRTRARAPTARRPRLAVAEERFPLVQRCRVPFPHDLDRATRP